MHFRLRLFPYRLTIGGTLKVNQQNPLSASHCTTTTTTATGSVPVLPIVYDRWDTSPSKGIVIHPTTVSLVSHHQQPQPMVAILHSQSSPMGGGGNGFQVPVSPNGHQLRQQSLHNHEDEAIQQQQLSVRNQLNRCNGGIWPPKLLSPTVMEKSPKHNRDDHGIIACLDRNNQSSEVASTEQMYFNEGEHPVTKSIYGILRYDLRFITSCRRCEIQRWNQQYMKRKRALLGEEHRAATVHDYQRNVCVTVMFSDGSLSRNKTHKM